MALQAIGNFSTCSGCLIGIVSMGFSGHIRLMVSVGAEVGVVSIQTSVVIYVGRGVAVGLCSCREHFVFMLAALLAYRAVMHVSGFAKGWKGIGMWQNCPFACLHTSNCVLDSSSPIVAYLVTPKYWVLMS